MGVWHSSDHRSLAGHPRHRVGKVQRPHSQLEGFPGLVGRTRRCPGQHRVQGTQYKLESSNPPGTQSPVERKRRNEKETKFYVEESRQKAEQPAGRQTTAGQGTVTHSNIPERPSRSGHMAQKQHHPRETVALEERDHCQTHHKPTENMTLETGAKDPREEPGNVGDSVAE